MIETRSDFTQYGPELPSQALEIYPSRDDIVVRCEGGFYKLVKGEWQKQPVCQHGTA